MWNNTSTSERNKSRRRRGNKAAKDQRRGNVGFALALLWSWFPWKDSFVFAPLLSMVGNAILAFGLGQVTSTDNPELLSKGLRMIGLVSNASISIVTLTFSLTVLSVQIASQSYSPRLLDEFIKDPVSKVVISVNLGAYAYCFTMIYFIDEDDPSPDVPYVAIHFLTIQIALVLITFINFIHFFINGFRIEQILKRASTSSMEAAKALSAQLDSNPDRDDQLELMEVPKDSFKVMSDESGYVTRFNLTALVYEAKRLDICIRYHHQVGDFVNRGTLMCYVWDAKTRQEELQVKLGDRLLEMLPCSNDEQEDNDNDKDNHNEKSQAEQVERRLGLLTSRGLTFSNKRSGDFDVTLGVQQLADIAVRALSPGINDPHTAIQCMDVLLPLMANLATMELALPNARDDNDFVRVCAPRRSFNHLLSMLDSIRVYGGADLSVCRRGLRFFGDLAAILTRTKRVDRIPAVLTQFEQWMVVCRKNFIKDSPELNSLEDLYNHLLRDISNSKNLLLASDQEENPTDGEEDVKDLQNYETTYDGKENHERKKEWNVVAEFLNKLSSPSSKPGEINGNQDGK